LPSLCAGRVSRWRPAPIGGRGRPRSRASPGGSRT
jgi:hypothetical protein